MNHISTCMTRLETAEQCSKSVCQMFSLTLNRHNNIRIFQVSFLETSSPVSWPPESPRVVQSPWQTVSCFSIFSCSPEAWPSLLYLFEGPSASYILQVQVQVQASRRPSLLTSKLLIGSKVTRLKAKAHLGHICKNNLFEERQ